MKKVVFLHGFGGSGASWQPVLRMLSPSIRTYCPAISGHERPFDSAVETLLSGSFEAEARRLLQDIQSQQVDGGLVVGYSLGARLALSMLCLEPERFAGAILMGVNPGLADDSQREARAQCDESWAMLARTMPLQTFFDRWEAQPLFERQRLLPPEVMGHQRSIRQTLRGDWLSDALLHLSLSRMPDYSRLVATLRIPVRVLAGEYDLKFVALSKQLAPQFQRGEFRSVSNSGHNVVLERPDIVVETVQELFNLMEGNSHGDECDESRRSLAVNWGV